jgi:hypothetical protein
MAALQTFDQALFESSTLDGDAWADEAVVLVGSVAAKLSDDDLVGLSAIWPNRPLLWQQHCAEVLGWARQDASIELLISLVDQADPQVALAALESLREFHPARFTAEQTKAILAALARCSSGLSDRSTRSSSGRFWRRCGRRGAGMKSVPGLGQGPAPTP